MAGNDVVKVLIAIDPSKQAEDAVHYYLQHIHKPTNQIVLASVIELPDTAHARQMYLSPAALSELWKEEVEKSKTLGDKFNELLKKEGVKDVTLCTEGGMKPGQVISKIAEEQKVKMIVMGTRGMGKIRRTLLGSVSDFVVHHAQCPVIVCRNAADLAAASSASQ